MAMQFSFDTYIARYLQHEGRCAIPQWGVLRLVRHAAQWQGDTLLAPYQTIEWEADTQTSKLWLNTLAGHTQTDISLLEKRYAAWLEQVHQSVQLADGYNLANLGTWQGNKEEVSWKTANQFNRGKSVTWPKGLDLAPATNIPSEETVVELEPANEAAASNNLLYIALALLILLLGGGLYWYNQQQTNQQTTSQTPEAPLAVPPSEPIQHDTMPSAVGDTLVNQSTGLNIAGDSRQYDVVVYHFSSQERAQKQADKFVRNLNDSRVVLGPDSQYLVVIRAVTTQPDTLRVVDSIRCFFNPKGRLYILK